MNKVQDNTKGIIFILLGMATFSIQDALIKFIYNDAALYELYFGRTLAAIILLVSYLKFLNYQNFEISPPSKRLVKFLEGGDSSKCW